jgi:hypothetical protein
MVGPINHRLGKHEVVPFLGNQFPGDAAVGISYQILNADRQSSRGGSGNECVEVADLADGGRAVCDSKDPGGPALRFALAQWAAFTAEVRDGELD